jgi:hypothetical protein
MPVSSGLIQSSRTPSRRGSSASGAA